MSKKFLGVQFFRFSQPPENKVTMNPETLEDLFCDQETADFFVWVTDTVRRKVKVPRSRKEVIKSISGGSEDDLLFGALNFLRVTSRICDSSLAKEDLLDHLQELQEKLSGLPTTSPARDSVLTAIGTLHSFIQSPKRLSITAQQHWLWNTAVAGAYWIVEGNPKLAKQLVEDVQTCIASYKPIEVDKILETDCFKPVVLRLQGRCHRLRALFWLNEGNVEQAELSLTRAYSFSNETNTLVLLCRVWILQSRKMDEETAIQKLQSKLEEIKEKVHSGLCEWPKCDEFLLSQSLLLLELAARTTPTKRSGYYFQIKTQLGSMKSKRELAHLFSAINHFRWYSCQADTETAASDSKFIMSSLNWDAVRAEWREIDPTFGPWWKEVLQDCVAIYLIRKDLEQIESDKEIPSVVLQEIKEQLQNGRLSLKPLEYDAEPSEWWKGMESWALECLTSTEEGKSDDDLALPSFEHSSEEN